jgi:hypothetical protein
MLIKNSKKAKNKVVVNEEIVEIIDSLRINYLENIIKQISIPRHYFAELSNNILNYQIKKSYDKSFIV